MRFAPSRAWARRLVVVVCVALPFAVWPGLPHAFSTPKLWLLVTGATAGLALACLTWRPTTHRVSSLVSWALFAHAGSFALAGWLAPVPPSNDALLLGLVAPAWALAVLALQPSVTLVAWGLAVATIGESAIVLLQWAGHDPFVALGWLPQIAGASPRLATYGTLGNPNFVAAWIALHLPVALAVAGQPRTNRHTLGAGTLGVAAAGAGLAALVATGSRAGVVAAAAGLMAFGVLRGRHVVTTAVAAAALCVAGIAVSTARPLDRTLAGRLYIWQVVASQALVHPLTGWGVGSVEVLYPGWEAQRHASAPLADATRAFAGPQPHAHNDVLDALAERGIPGVLGLVLACAAWWGCTRRATAGEDATLAAGFAASLVAFGVAMLVDFPAARPAESAAAFTSLACLALAARGSVARATTSSADGHCASTDNG